MKRPAEDRLGSRIEPGVLKCQRRLRCQSLEGIQRGFVEWHPVDVPVGGEDPDSLALGDKGENGKNPGPQRLDLVVRGLEAKAVWHGAWSSTDDCLFC